MADLRDQTENQVVKAASTAAVAADPALVVSLSPNSAVTPPAITKGTQGATGFTTQPLRDAGRVRFSAATVIAGVTAVTTEALLTMTPVRDAVAGSAATTFAVTSNKKLRLTHIVVGYVLTSSANTSMRFALRCNPSGAVAVTSPIELIVPFGAQTTTATTQMGTQIAVPIPEGFEYAGTHQLGLSLVASATTATVWASLVGYEY